MKKRLEHHITIISTVAQPPFIRIWEMLTLSVFQLDELEPLRLHQPVVPARSCRHVLLCFGGAIGAHEPRAQ